MTVFWCAVFIMIAVSLLFIVLPLYGGKELSLNETDIIHERIYEDKLAILTHDYEGGLITFNEFQESLGELEKTKSNDEARTKVGAVSLSNNNRLQLTIILLVCVPVLALSIF